MLLSNWGQTLGLFLGASAISMIELLVFFSMAASVIVKKMFK